MDCRAFREHHGDWVDDVVDPALAEDLASHLAACAACARFDTLARRALMVARNAPPIEVSAAFSARLAARIAEERRARIASHAPSHAETGGGVGLRGGAMTWARRAAAVAAVIGGTVVLRGTVGAGTAASPMPAMDAAALIGSDMRFDPYDAPAAAPAGGSGGEIVVVRPVRAVGGALLPSSDDPLLDGEDNASLGDAHATTVAATAPLWPTAMMAAHAAHRFAAMEFGDVTPVSLSQIRR